MARKVICDVCGKELIVRDETIFAVHVTVKNNREYAEPIGDRFHDGLEGHEKCVNDVFTLLCDLLSKSRSEEA